jgi:putative protease
MYALVSNIAQITAVKSLGFEIFGDFRLNVTNSESRIAYEQMGVSHQILSPELTLPKARDIGGGLITYGRIPLMVTERCFISENFGCDKCGSAALVDRKGERFPIIRLQPHRNVIFNSLPTYMGDRSDELHSYRIGWEHLIFSTEDEGEIISTLGAISDGTALNRRVRRIGRR